LRFGPTQGVTLPLDEVFELIARNFNEASVTKAPRLKTVIESLDSVAEAATTLALKLESLDPYVRAALLGTVMLRISGMLQEPLPEDDRSVAFAPEIDAAKRRDDERRYDDRQFLKPMVERLTALSRIAKRNRPAKLDDNGDNIDKGGKVTILSERGIGEPKTELAKDCFWLLSYCFGRDVAEQKISGTTEHSAKRKGPSFVNLVTEMFKLAVGNKHPDESFERAVENVVKGIKSKEWQLAFRKRPWPLTGFTIFQIRNSAAAFPKPKGRNLPK
jgi:hypothetical protein